MIVLLLFIIELSVNRVGVVAEKTEVRRNERCETQVDEVVISCLFKHDSQ